MTFKRDSSVIAPIQLLLDELRTPLNGMSGLLSLLEELRLPSEANGLLDHMRECIDRMAKALSKMNSLAGSVSSKRFSVEYIPAVVENVIAMQTKSGSNGSVQTVCDFDDKLLNLRFRAQFSVVTEALYHLIEKAMNSRRKEGVVVVQGKVGQFLGPVAWIEIAVTDTGTRIGHSNFKNVFEAFYREDSGTSGRFEEVGVGLSIAKDAAKSLGGDLSVSSIKDIGTQFRLEFLAEKVCDFRTEGA